VPASIERDELAAEFERDPAAMARLGFEAIDAAGRVVEPAEAIPRLRTGALRLRQAPGPRNALGLVKFDLRNPYGVYLHGTPAQRLFGRARRDLSHGCIRLEDAEALAARVLGWPRERVRAAMLGEETLEVFAPVRFPVLILYSTAVVRDDGAVQFLEDVYGKDAALESALERARAQPFRASAGLRPQDSRRSGAALGLQWLRRDGRGARRAGHGG
jgi:murein L,D-transpeptidase YcbB/YkuD